MYMSKQTEVSQKINIFIRLHHHQTRNILKSMQNIDSLSFLIYKFFCLYILANLYSNGQATLYVGAYAIFANIDKTPGFLIKMIYLTVLNWLPQ